MHPRTVKMAAEVASQFSASQLDEYGNIILNGYINVITDPLEINKKAWQYQETTTAPANLPSVATVRPVYKGWTTNYMQYYTQLPPNAYGDLTPGMPTMFDYSVHSFTPFRGPIVSATYVTYGELYTPGSYTGVATTASDGGALATVFFDVDAYGHLTNFGIDNPGGGYRVGELLAALDVGQGGSEPIVFHITDVEIASGGVPKYAERPRRRNNAMIPVADYQGVPPIDIL